MANQYTPIPLRTREAMVDYILRRTPPGDFMRAVFENDLTGALCHADEENRAAIHPIVIWAYNFAPAICRGSKQAVDNWLANEDGLMGKITTGDIQSGIQRFVVVTLVHLDPRLRGGDGEGCLLGHMETSMRAHPERHAGESAFHCSRGRRASCRTELTRAAAE